MSRRLPALLIAGLLAGCTNSADSSAATDPPTSTTLFLGDATMEQALAAFDGCTTPPDSAITPERPGSPTQGDDETRPIELNSTVAPGETFDLEWQTDTSVETNLAVYCWKPDEDWTVVYLATGTQSGIPQVIFSDPEVGSGTAEITEMRRSGQRTEVGTPEFSPPGSFMVEVGFFLVDDPSQSFFSRFYFNVE